MMTKTKSTLTRGLRVLWLIPLMCMCVGLQTQTVYDDFPILPENAVVLNLNADGLVYVNGPGYGVEIERVGLYLRGMIGNRVYPPMAIQVDASPEAPAGSAEQLQDELRKVGLLKINRVRHE